MEKSFSQIEWANEFMEFLEAEPALPPEAISEKILKTVSNDLNIPLWKILFKVAAIQSVVAMATLLICPQFEVDFVIMGHNDAHLKAILGETAYMALCGAIFLSSGTLIATLLLTVEELRAVKKTRYGYFFLASLFALLTFYKFGVPSVSSDYAAWLAGAFVGSVISFEVMKGMKLLRKDSALQ